MISKCLHDYDIQSITEEDKYLETSQEPFASNGLRKLKKQNMNHVCSHVAYQRKMDLDIIKSKP